MRNRSSIPGGSPIAADGVLPSYVIYTGIRQKPSEIAAAALQEDVSVVGLSILSGAHLSLTRKVVNALREAGAEDVHVVVGGTIPAGDVPTLGRSGQPPCTQPAPPCRSSSSR